MTVARREEMQSGCSHPDVEGERAKDNGGWIKILNRTRCSPSAAAKTVVSTPLDEDTLKRLDALCAEIHRTRAEVLRGLLYTLVVPEKYFIIDEWRASAKSGAGTPA